MLLHGLNQLGGLDATAYAEINQHRMRTVGDHTLDGMVDNVMAHTEQRNIIDD